MSVPIQLYTFETDHTITQRERELASKIMNTSVPIPLYTFETHHTFTKQERDFAFTIFTCVSPRVSNRYLLELMVARCVDSKRYEELSFRFFITSKKRYLFPKP